MQEITFFDKEARKSLKITYELTGDGNAPVLPNVIINSPYKTKDGWRRVITLKKFTEQMLIERAEGGKYYV